MRRTYILVKVFSHYPYQLQHEGIDLEKDEFIILAGRKYRENLLGPGKIVHYKNVYEENNLHGIGCILKFLSNNVNE